MMTAEILQLMLQEGLNQLDFFNYIANQSVFLKIKDVTTVKGVRKDFAGLYPDMLCPLGCGQDDSLPNILTCSVLKSLHTSQNISSSDVKYEDIFSPDITKQKQVTEMYRQLLEIRRNLQNSQPVASNGPVHHS